MTDSNSKESETGKTIWEDTNLDELVDAIASLGDHVAELKHETWRLNAKTKSSNSLWYQVISKCQKLENNERTRFSLYKIWLNDRRKIKELVAIKQQSCSTAQNQSNNNINTVVVLNNQNLPPELSLPLPERPNTRANQTKEADANHDNQNLVINEICISFTPLEWKSVFSRTHQNMKSDWRDLFRTKLKSEGIKCPLCIEKPHIKEGKRKRNCKFFGFNAACGISICPRHYQAILKHEPNETSMLFFIVKIYNEENHDKDIEISAVQLRGEERLRVGQRVNEIGPLAVYHEHIRAADPSLLDAGNYTGCETIETLKKSGVDVRKKMFLDEDIHRDCRLASRIYCSDDPPSKPVRGYIHDKSEMPFGMHLYSQMQIERYIAYCKSEKYSFVHIDATGGILKSMSDQAQILLYAIIFKDGIDGNDTVPLAHALLSKHTVPRIGYFLSELAYDISQVNHILIHPSFFVIDFSAALMNSILLAFNAENINTHLNRCWNVLCRKYNTSQLRSLSFIHFCCCHVIKAIARSLTAAHIDKKIRRGVLHIFACVLCGNDLTELYDLLGLVINIFGDPHEQNAQEKFEQLLSLQLNVDDESASELSDQKKIFEEAKEKNAELRAVDEYFRANTPIIHQSPFNTEAIRRFPNLTALINSKSKYNNIVNPLFSPTIIRIFYRWWAYLPLWTGLLWNFEERYSINSRPKQSITYEPKRYSNALIESYFRTLKQSILGKKIHSRPLEVILRLKARVESQFKAKIHGVTQSSKGRKRKKKNVDSVNPTEQWSKRGKGKKRHNLYLKVANNVINKFASKRVRTQVDDSQSNEIIRISESDGTTTLSSSNKTTPQPSLSNKSTPSPPSSNKSTPLPSNTFHVDMSLNQSSSSDKNQSTSSSSKTNSKGNDEDLHDIQINSDKSIDNANDSANQEIDSDKDIDADERSEASIEYDFDADITSSIISTLYPAANKLIATTEQSSKKRNVELPYNPETTIDGHTLRWPVFEIHNYFFEGRSYTLKNTCPTDSALFILFFLYRTDALIFDKLNDYPEGSPYSTLIKTFQMVDTEGWDAARIYCLLELNVIKRTDPPIMNLFDYADEQVLHFIKNEQRHSMKIVCTRPDCVEKERCLTTTDLNVFPSDTKIEKFEVENIGTCATMIKLRHEISEKDAQKYKYKSGRVPSFNYQTNENEYKDAWICNSPNITHPCTFDYGHPSIILVNIKPNIRRLEEGYEPNPVRLRDMKPIVRIGPFQYKLRAVMHHTSRPEHFTATIIGRDNILYLYDDLNGVKQVRNSTNTVGAWFCLKKPSTYARRRGEQRERNIVIDAVLSQQPTPRPIVDVLL